MRPVSAELYFLRRLGFGLHLSLLRLRLGEIMPMKPGERVVDCGLMPRVCRYERRGGAVRSVGMVAACTHASSLCV